MVGYFRMVDAYVSVDHTGTAEPVRNHVCARSTGMRGAAVIDDHISGSLTLERRLVNVLNVRSGVASQRAFV